MCSHNSVQNSLVAYQRQTIYIHQRSLTIVTISNTVVDGSAIRTAVHPLLTQAINMQFDQNQMTRASQIVAYSRYKPD